VVRGRGPQPHPRPSTRPSSAQLDTLDYATAFQVGSNDQAFALAERIAALAPGDLDKVLFCNSGSEAADTSLKVALAYHRARGEGHRTVFIGRERGYHGVGFGGMSVGGIPANRKVFGAALLPRVDHLRFIHDPVNHAYVHHQEPVWAETRWWSWRPASSPCTTRATSRPSSSSRWPAARAGTSPRRATSSACARSATSTASC
jgi:hypothetical protein